MSNDGGSGLLIFDGDCGFCTMAANWAEKGFRHGESAQPWQLLGAGVLDSFGLSLDDVEGAAWWVDSAGTRERGHRAAGRALQAGGAGRRLAGFVTLAPPTSWLADLAYRLVVRWRYRLRLPGGSPACQPPRKGPIV